MGDDARMRPVYPTTASDRSSAEKRSLLLDRATRGKRRLRQTPPKLLVDGGYEGYRRLLYGAHLRNKGGYLYLCWREGEHIRNYYLGKARRVTRWPEKRRRTERATLESVPRPIPETLLRPCLSKAFPCASTHWSMPPWCDARNVTMC